MSEFKVVLDDLTTLATNFATESATYERLIPAINPPAVDSGDANLNSVLAGMVGLFGNLHERIVASIDDHAITLKNARDAFERADMWGGTRYLYDDLVPKS